MEPSAVSSILLVRTDRIGDVVLSLPMLPVLRRAYPSAKITMLVRPYTAEIVNDHPYVNEVLLWSDENKKSIFSTASLLRSKRFDIAILPYPRLNLALSIYAAGIPLRVGTGYRWYSFLFNKKMYEHRKDGKKHESEYNLNLLTTLGIENRHVPEFMFPIPGKMEKKVDALLKDDGLAGKPYAILHPGSGGSARDWPLQNFAALGNRLRDEMKMPVVLTGGSNEQELVRIVQKSMTGKSVNYAGRFSLKELGALISRAAVFVSNSTGPLHIAAAVGTPVVAFYPPIVQCSPTRWGPYSAKKKIFTSDNTICELCRGGRCRSNVCMEQITVDDVMTGIKELMGERNA